MTSGHLQFMYGHFCLVPRVSVHDRYYCTSLCILASHWTERCHIKHTWRRPKRKSEQETTSLKMGSHSMQPHSGRPSEACCHKIHNQTTCGRCQKCVVIKYITRQHADFVCVVYINVNYVCSIDHDDDELELRPLVGSPY